MCDFACYALIKGFGCDYRLTRRELEYQCLNVLFARVLFYTERSSRENPAGSRSLMTFDEAGEDGGLPVVEA